MFRVASLPVNSAVAPIVPAVSDNGTGTESLAWDGGTWYVALDVANALFPSH